LIVVIDTNVWVSALRFGNPTSAPFQAIRKAHLVDHLATAAELYAEALRVLTTRFAWDESKARAALDLFHDKATFHQLTDAVHLCRDPADDMFLECAFIAQADLLVTGDKDLLELEAFRGTRIVNPAEYISLSSFAD
jgi:putative PIN family toxin of toxin-antitoxin system